jgi:uncharacterized phage protein (TIGR01671 family)
MTREIKFRLWNAWLKRFERDFEIRRDFKKFTFWVDDNENDEVVELDEINQYTGLKDKKGKEIYEGDIIKWFADGINKFAEVIWKDCGWCAKRFDKELNRFEKYYNFNQFIPVEVDVEGKEDMFDGEVVGNIYENPKLIETIAPRSNSSEQSSSSQSEDLISVKEEFQK